MGGANGEKCREVKGEVPPFLFLNPPLGAFVGLLIAMPYNLTKAESFMDGFLTTFSVMLIGGLMGYRKRRSRLFLYTSLFCALFLIALLSFIAVNPAVISENNGS